MFYLPLQNTCNVNLNIFNCSKVVVKKNPNLSKGKSEIELTISETFQILCFNNALYIKTMTSFGIDVRLNISNQNKGSLFVQNLV